MGKHKPTWTRERILDNITINEKTGCWTIDSGDGPKPRHPARSGWRAFNGEIDDRWVLHKCRTQNCMNPGHLYLGTSYENKADMTNRDRHKSHYFYHWRNNNVTKVW